MHQLTGFQRDLLFIISGMQKPHGLAIKSEIEDYYGKEVNRGHLYPNLNELADIGLVKKTQKDSRTNSYSLTEKGRRSIHSRHDWEADRLTRKSN